MYIVETHEYDQLTGNNYEQVKFHDYDSAEDYFEAQRSKDFDYGNHYRKTTMFEVGES
jgi:hypothetical protein